MNTEAQMKSLVGRKIVDAWICPHPDDDQDYAFLTLDNETTLLILADPEGNGPGYIHVHDEALSQ